MESFANSMWPLIVILVVLITLVILGMFQRSRNQERMTKTEILLPACYSVNGMYNILIHGRLPEKENVFYETYFFWLRFSPDGHVFIRRQFNGRNICWERFGQNGESLGLVKKSEIQRMEISGEILRANYIAKQGDRIAAVVVDFKDYE